MKQKGLIFDLDGTLCNLDHRLHHIKQEKPDWEAFGKASGEDTPHEWCVILAKTMRAAHYQILFVTGREEIFKPQTEWWLKTHLEWLPVIDYKLFMRPEKDYIPDEQLKERIYKSLIEPEFDVLFVVDDRDKVCKKWRELGLRTLQCDEGNF